MMMIGKLRAMSGWVFVLALVGLALPQSQAQPAKGGQGDAVAASGETSYAIGYDLGKFIAQRLRDDGVEANLDELLEGVGDALKEAPARVSSAQMHELLRDLSDEVDARRGAAQLASDPVYRALAKENQLRSRRFHELYGQQGSVTTLPSGVQFQMIVEGEGESPAADDTVVVSYECKLISGIEVADEDRVELELEGVMPGGREILSLMRPGARWKVAIPPELAFGEAGSPPNIGPNETLIIEVELHEIAGSEQ